MGVLWIYQAELTVDEDLKFHAMLEGTMKFYDIISDSITRFSNLLNNSL